MWIILLNTTWCFILPSGTTPRLNFPVKMMKPHPTAQAPDFRSFIQTIKIRSEIVKKNKKLTPTLFSQQLVGFYLLTLVTSNTNGMIGLLGSRFCMKGEWWRHVTVEGWRDFFLLSYRGSFSTTSIKTHVSSSYFAENIQYM